MSISILLAAGKSVMGMKDHPSPYRMRTENLLPKFESAKKSTTTSAKTECVDREAAILPTALNPTPPLPAARMETPSLFDAGANSVADAAPLLSAIIVDPLAAAKPIAVRFEEQPPAPVPVVLAAAIAPKSHAPAPPVKTPAAPSVVRNPRPGLPAKPRLFAVWMQKFNPLAYWPGRGNDRSRPRPAVQTELSLERIRVARNDLSDADLEVMTAKHTGAGRGMIGPRLRWAAGTETTTLSRLGARLFGRKPAQAR